MKNAMKFVWVVCLVFLCRVSLGEEQRERPPGYILPPQKGQKCVSCVNESDCQKIVHIESLGWTSGHKTKFCHAKGFDGHYNAKKCDYDDGGYCFNGIPEACAMKVDEIRCSWKDKTYFDFAPQQPSFHVSFRFSCVSKKNGSSDGDVGIEVISPVSCKDAMNEAKRIFNEERNGEPCVFSPEFTDMTRRWNGNVENIASGECSGFEW